MTIEEMYAEICQLESGLNDWELTFIQDVGKRVDQGKLSERQRDTIEKIYYEKCDGSTYIE
jgi:hypothetical protein